MITSGWSYSTGWASTTRTSRTVPARGAWIWFITFIASTISNVSPSLTVSPGATNGFEPGSPERKTVPTIGDLTAPGWLAGATEAPVAWKPPDAAGAGGGGGAAATEAGAAAITFTS